MDVAVDVAGDGDTRVTNPLRNRGQGHTSLHQVGDVAVSEVMEPDLRQACIAAGLLKALSEDNRDERRAVLLSEYEADLVVAGPEREALRRLPTAVFAKHCDRAVVECDCSPSRRGLGL